MDDESDGTDRWPARERVEPTEIKFRARLRDDQCAWRMAYLRRMKQKRAMAVLVVGVLTVMGVGCRSTSSAARPPVAPAASPVDEATTTTTQAPARKPFPLSAIGQKITDPFDLDGGNFSLSYSFTSNCSYSATLESTSGDPSASKALANGMGPMNGDANLDGVGKGNYYVKVITGPGCDWTINLTPR